VSNEKEQQRKTNKQCEYAAANDERFKRVTPMLPPEAVIAETYCDPFGLIDSCNPGIRVAYGMQSA
jgi:hypothetical protein